MIDNAGQNWQYPGSEGIKELIRIGHYLQMWMVIFRKGDAELSVR
jgi:hypothetical protein